VAGTLARECRVPHLSRTLRKVGFHELQPPDQADDPEQVKQLGYQLGRFVFDK